jgi:hypothetical protein
LDRRASDVETEQAALNNNRNYSSRERSHRRGDWNRWVQEQERLIANTNSTSVSIPESPSRHRQHSTAFVRQTHGPQNSFDAARDWIDSGVVGAPSLHTASLVLQSDGLAAPVCCETLLSTYQPMILVLAGRQHHQPKKSSTCTDDNDRLERLTTTTPVNVNPCYSAVLPDSGSGSRRQLSWRAILHCGSVS